MSLPTSTPGCRPCFLEDRHRHRPMPSGMRVGRQPCPRLRPNRALVKTDQRDAVSAPVRNPGRSSTGGPTTAPPGGNSSKAKSKMSPCQVWPTRKSQFPPQGGLTARRSPSLRGALRSLRPYTTHSNGNGSMATMERVCERGAHSDPCASFGFLSTTFHLRFSFSRGSTR